MAAPADVAALTERLGRAPQADFEVVVRDAAGGPVVVRNVPFTRDGTPMPTRYWLVDPDLNLRISRLEAAGGVRVGPGRGRPRRPAGRPRRLRGRARRRSAGRARRAAPVGWGRGHPRRA